MTLWPSEMVWGEEGEAGVERRGLGVQEWLRGGLGGEVEDLVKCPSDPGHLEWPVVLVWCKSCPSPEPPVFAHQLFSGALTDPLCVCVCVCVCQREREGEFYLISTVSKNCLLLYVFIDTNRL